MAMKIDNHLYYIVKWYYILDCHHIDTLRVLTSADPTCSNYMYKQTEDKFGSDD